MTALFGHNVQPTAHCLTKSDGNNGLYLVEAPTKLSVAPGLEGQSNLSASKFGCNFAQDWPAADV